MSTFFERLQSETQAAREADRAPATLETVARNVEALRFQSILRPAASRAQDSAARCDDRSACSDQFGVRDDFDHSRTVVGQCPLQVAGQLLKTEFPGIICPQDMQGRNSNAGEGPVQVTLVPSDQVVHFYFAHIPAIGAVGSFKADL